ncbi:C45 family autoproteolytic acyltransferase/hydolase [Jeotgalicoccus psychrophilus]|uniref:C45 family autoproteolytic acyltransferase/hydolase n=1 Tax=Jeotgalicoccus psychrophilus TaxID=157228 RepID=UPI0003F6AACD|nr:C45 family peptidase [Jeotgalicoccus psychrophilus]
MKSYYSDVFQFRGTHYDFGYLQGQQLKNSPILPNRERQWRKRENRHFIVDPETSMNMLRKIAPQVLDEIQGLADALELDITEAFKKFGGYYLELTRSGCSIFTGNDFFVRNYDSHPRGYEGRYIFYQPTDRGYAFMGPTMQITGRIDGMNEKGLVIGYNFTHTKKSADGFMCSMIARLVLETCANTDEAVALLKDIPHRHSFSYVVQDSRGIPYVIEASPRNVAVRQSNICTNHFHMLQEENRYRQEESLQREQNIMNKQQNTSKPYEAFKIMNSLNEGIASTKYDASAGTIHTSVYMPKELKALFVIGLNRKPVIFDFNKWLQGKDINITKIKGELDFDKPFVNMK